MKPIFKFAIREDLQDLGNLFLPRQAEPLASGFDVRAAMPDREDLVIRPGEYFKIPLGIRGFCPDGWYYQLHPRSSSFAKKHIHNLIGVIDESFEGELLWAGQYIPEYRTDTCNSQLLNTAYILTIKFAEAIGQIIPMQRNEIITENISNEEYNKLCDIRNASRKAGGFGSTSEIK